MKHVLVLGSGLVARPLIRHLLGKGHAVVVATLELERAKQMIAGHPHGKAFLLDVQDEVRLAPFFDECDLVVSLLPFSHHPQVARRCIAARKHMVTTSYVSAAMQELDGMAQAAGVILLNEVGVDPGLDHMTAMRVIDGARRRGGRVGAFRSYCGGLPAPEANDNPFGYKFSWAPRGVLLASRNGAQYLQDGRKVEVAPHRLFRDMHILAVDGLGDFEAYPNRDAISYVDTYGLGGIQTMYRGTLRNMGWCDSLFNIGRLGLLSLDEIEVMRGTYADLMRRLIGCRASDDLKTAAAARLGIPREASPILNLDWLGMFSLRKFAADRIAPLDALGDLMYERLAYLPGERDMLVMRHEFRIEYAHGLRERVLSQMIDFGVPHGDTSMSRTVALPAAIAVDLILSGHVRTAGVVRPTMPDLYLPVLEELTELGIACRETTEVY